jgi:hypothetical protein
MATGDRPSYMTGSALHPSNKDRADDDFLGGQQLVQK